MTFAEWWDSLTTREQNSTNRDLTKAAWQVSAMLMREQCAKACSDLRRANYSGETGDWIDGTEDCAKAILALGD